MNRLIAELKKKPLSGRDIVTSCDNRIKVVPYPDLAEYETIDDVFGDYDAIALLYETKPQYGHWVGLFRHPESHTIEFFDPYAYFIDDQLEFIQKDFRRNSNQDFPHLTELLVQSDYNIIYNPVKIQAKRKDVSSCGRHVTLRCVLKDIPLGEYLGLLTSERGKSPDEIVTYLTAFI